MIHSCSYYCHIPECIKAQRDELRDKLFNREWVGLNEQERNHIEDYCEMIIGKPAFDAIEAALKEKNT